MSVVRTERDKRGLATITLDRPAVRNAFDEEVVAKLTEAARSAGDARAVVLRSEGDVFCAGADLEWMKRQGKASREENYADALRLADMYAALADIPAPLVVRVQGAAIGGGAGLVSTGDVVVASTAATFAFAEVRVGILPSAVSPFVVRRLGPARASALFVTGERFGARRAYEIGFIDRLAEPADLDRAVEETLAQILAGAPSGVRASKRIVRQVAGKAHAEVRELTARTIAEQRATEDGIEGFDAFLEKRKPRWMT